MNAVQFANRLLAGHAEIIADRARSLRGEESMVTAHFNESSGVLEMLFNSATGGTEESQVQLLRLRGKIPQYVQQFESTGRVVRTVHIVEVFEGSHKILHMEVL